MAPDMLAGEGGSLGCDGAYPAWDMGTAYDSATPEPPSTKKKKKKKKAQIRLELCHRDVITSSFPA